MSRDQAEGLRPWCERCGREGQELEDRLSLVETGRLELLCPRCIAELRKEAVPRFCPDHRLDQPHKDCPTCNPDPTEATS